MPSQLCVCVLFFRLFYFCTLMSKKVNPQQGEYPANSAFVIFNVQYLWIGPSCFPTTAQITKKCVREPSSFPVFLCSLIIFFLFSGSFLYLFRNAKWKSGYNFALLVLARLARHLSKWWKLDSQPWSQTHLRCCRIGIIWDAVDLGLLGLFKLCFFNLLRQHS